MRFTHRQRAEAIALMEQAGQYHWWYWEAEAYDCMAEACKILFPEGGDNGLKEEQGKESECPQTTATPKPRKDSFRVSGNNQDWWQQWVERERIKAQRDRDSRERERNRWKDKEGPADA